MRLWRLYAGRRGFRYLDLTRDAWIVHADSSVSCRGDRHCGHRDCMGLRGGALNDDLVGVQAWLTSFHLWAI